MAVSTILICHLNAFDSKSPHPLVERPGWETIRKSEFAISERTR
jgi:hypothetical protein